MIISFLILAISLAIIYLCGSEICGCKNNLRNYKISIRALNEGIELKVSVMKYRHFKFNWDAYLGGHAC
jgi:hypothetical protein